LTISQIAAFPDEPQHLMTIAWGDRQVRVRLTWRNRTASWYLDVFELGDGEQTGAALVRGRRVSPRWAPLAGLRVVGLPQSPILVVDAAVRSDPFSRSELGRSVRNVLVDADDFPPVVVAFPDLLVTIVP